MSATPSPTIRTLRNSAKLLMARVLGVGVQFVYLLVVARTLPGIELVALPIMTILNELAARLSDLGLASTCVQQIPALLNTDQHERAASMARTAIVLPFLLSLGCSAALLWQAESVAALLFKDAGAAPYVRLIALGIAGYRLQTTMLFLLQAWQRFGLLGAVRVGNNVVRLLSLVGYWVGDLSGLLAVLVAGQWLLALIPLLGLGKALWAGFTLYAPGPFAAYSMPYYLTGFVRFGTMQADQLLVGIALQPEQLAAYYVIRQFFDLLVMYIDTLTDSLLPRLSELRTVSADKAAQTFRRVSRFLAVVIVPPCCMAAALAYPLLQVYGSDRYLQAHLPLTTLALAGIFYTSFSYYGSHVYMLTRPANQLWQELVASLLNVGIGLLLMVRLGIQGFAIARALSLWGATVFSAYLLRRAYPVQLDYPALARVLGITLLSCAVMVLGQALFPQLWAAPLYVLLGGSVFVLLLSRYLQEEDFAVLRQALPAPLYRAAVLPIVRLRTWIWR